jgi:hypothetical protein
MEDMSRGAPRVNSKLLLRILNKAEQQEIRESASGILRKRFRTLKGIADETSRDRR